MVIFLESPVLNSSTQRLQSVIGIADTQSNILMGGTPLMFASVMGQTDIVKWLLEVGCDINAQDENNKLVVCSIFGRFLSYSLLMQLTQSEDIELEVLQFA